MNNQFENIGVQNPLLTMKGPPSL